MVEIIQYFQHQMPLMSVLPVKKKNYLRLQLKKIYKVFNLSLFILNFILHINE